MVLSPFRDPRKVVSGTPVMMEESASSGNEID